MTSIAGPAYYPIIKYVTISSAECTEITHYAFEKFQGPQITSYGLRSSLPLKELWKCLCFSEILDHRIVD
jgi:hypothetical protein